MPIKIAEHLSEFSNELVKALLAAGESVLSASVSELILVDRCRCGADFCGGFYTQPAPAGAFEPGHRNVVLDPTKGTIYLDVVNDRIYFVECLNRDDVRLRLDRLMPIDPIR